MKKLALIISLLLISTIVIAGPIESPTKTYEHYFQDSVLIINTKAPLMFDKGIAVVNASDVATKCNEVGKALYKRILKIGPIESVAISYRQLAVKITPYPHNLWDETLPLVLAEVDSVLAPKKKEKK